MRNQRNDPAVRAKSQPNAITRDTMDFVLLRRVTPARKQFVARFLRPCGTHVAKRSKSEGEKAKSRRGSRRGLEAFVSRELQ